MEPNDLLVLVALAHQITVVALHLATLVGGAEVSTRVAVYVVGVMNNEVCVGDTVLRVGEQQP
jgi:hypothetical protein